MAKLTKKGDSVIVLPSLETQKTGELLPVKFENDLVALSIPAEGFPTIRNKGQYNEAEKLITTIKALVKSADHEFEVIDGPLKEARSKWAAKWKTFYHNAKVYEADLREKMGDLLTIMDTQAKALEMAINDGSKKGPKAYAKLGELKNVAAHTNTRTVKEAVVTNLAKIPREFMVPDMARIKAALDAGQKVPGAELKERKQIVVKA